MPLLSFLSTLPARPAGRPLLIDGRHSLDAAALQPAINAAAQWLRTQAPAGAAVGLQLPNGVELVTLLLALGRNGQPAVLFAHDAAAHEVQAHAAATGLALHIGDQAGDGLPSHCGLPWAPALWLRTQDSAAAGRLLPPDTFIVQFTSGQDSPAKQAARSHAAVAAEIHSLVQALALDANDRVLVATRISHSYGLIGGVLAGLATGAQVLLAPGTDAPTLLDLDRRHAPTVLLGVPPLYRALLAHKLRGHWPALRLALSAGAPLPADLAAAFQARTDLHICQDYGATECGTISLGSRADSLLTGCVGRPLPHLRVQVRGPAGESLAVGEVGDVVVEAGDGAATPAPFVTGDLGRWDAEGRLFLHGRRSSLINIGGRPVDPAPLEARLAALPGVQDVAITANGNGGLQVHAVAPDAPDGGGAALLAACRQALGPQLPVDALRLLPRLPRSAAGKILRRSLLAAPEARQEPQP